MTAPRASRVRVPQFGGPEVLELEEFSPGRPSRRNVRVQVTHASVGSTDATARSGGYVLQPRPGFVPGYDFAGVLETVSPAAARRGLRPGMRVAGCLARMGSYTTVLDVPAARVVPLPDSMDSARAAALPLDLVTAALAIELAQLSDGATVFIQGVSGSVGALITQYAVAHRMRVIGTASERTRAFAETLGADVVDYNNPNWPARVRDLVPQGADGSVDHTGGDEVRSATARSGTVVRTAWNGGRVAAARGGLLANARRFASPRERLCSVPLLVASQPGKYRRILHDQLAKVGDRTLTGPDVTVVPFSDVVDAHRALASLKPGHKVVLEMPGRQ